MYKSSVIYLNAFVVMLITYLFFDVYPPFYQ